MVATLATGPVSPASVSPYPDAVGRVEFDGGSCTGVLIAPRQVLTAAPAYFTHRGPVCTRKTADGRRARSVLQPARVYGQVAAVGQVVEIVVPAAYNYTPEPESAAAVVADVALLRLDDGDFPVELRHLARGAVTEPFDVIGYPPPMSQQPRRQHACTVADRDMPDGVLATTCSGIPGASGAPLVEYGKPPTVLGMVVANRKRTGIALSAAHIRRLLGRR